jgi:23S rRNA pseudouridine1911/1915/1917 synthase
VHEIEHEIASDQVNTRIDVLVGEHAKVSRSYAQKLISMGYVWCNETQVANSYRVKLSDEIVIQIPESEALDLVPTLMDLDIVYEDHDVIVINKAVDMVVHPAPSYHKPTLVEGLLAHCDDLSGINGVNRPGIVHRIDKDTSGLLVVAKNDAAHQALSNQLQDKSMGRVYHALVNGQVFPDEFNIDAPIGRDPKNRQNMAVTEKNSRDGFTVVRVLERFAHGSLVECTLKTGRTHQIRVHMQFIGHSVLNDPKYGPRKGLKTGQLLHARELHFIHPTTKAEMHFIAEYPDHFKQGYQALKEDGA